MNTAAPRSLPLLAARDLDAPLVWRHGKPVSARTVLAQAQALASRLPRGGTAVNLCADRHRFIVGFAAALLRGHASALPPDARDETLAAVAPVTGPCYALVDAVGGASGPLPAFSVDLVAPDAPPQATPAIPADAEAAWLLTSGSTGTPQPHGKQWGTLVANVGSAAPRLAQLMGRASMAGVQIAATVPSQHSYGFESVILLTMLGGAACDAERPYYPADVAAALERLPRPRMLVTTPFHLKTLLQSGVPLPQADLVLSATAPLSLALAGQAERAFGGPLVEIYGCTEAGQLATRRPLAGEEWTAFDGLVFEALPGQGSTGANHDEQVDRYGVRGGHAGAERVPLGDRLALRDGQHFRLLGRTSDLVHVAGRRTSLAYLEHQLLRVPGVQDGAFWLPPDVADGVVRPVAFVVAPGITAQAIAEALRERLEAVFVPRRIVHVESLPRAATGKLTARALAGLAATFHAGVPAPVRAECRMPAEHPSFDGHFPGQPLLPGAMLLCEVLEVLRAAPALVARTGAAPLLASAKFLAPVRPGDTLAIALAADPDTDAVDFTVHCGATEVARGRWQPGAPEAAA